MSFSKAVSPADESHGLRIVHTHAAKHFTDLQSANVRVWIPKRAGRVDVNQAHSIRSERIGTVALDGAGKLLCLDFRGAELQAVCSIFVIYPASTESKNRSFELCY